MAGQFLRSSADDQQERFLYKLNDQQKDSSTSHVLYLNYKLTIHMHIILVQLLAKAAGTAARSSYAPSVHQSVGYDAHITLLYIMQIIIY